MSTYSSHLRGWIGRRNGGMENTSTKLYPFLPLSGLAHPAAAIFICQKVEP